MTRVQLSGNDIDGNYNFKSNIVSTLRTNNRATVSASAIEKEYLPEGNANATLTEKCAAIADAVGANYEVTGENVSFTKPQTTTVTVTTKESDMPNKEVGSITFGWLQAGRKSPYSFHCHPTVDLSEDQLAQMAPSIAAEILAQRNKVVGSVGEYDWHC
jgi:hypothetical protein